MLRLRNRLFTFFHFFRTLTDLLLFFLQLHPSLLIKFSLAWALPCSDQVQKLLFSESLETMFLDSSEFGGASVVS